MNKPTAPIAAIQQSPATAAPEGASHDEQPTLGSYLHVILDARRLILLVTLAVLAAGCVSYVLATPVYRSDALVQVEDKKTGLSALEELGALEATSATETEVEVLRSRTLLGAVVEELHLDIVAEPRFLPFIGRGIARRRSAGEPAAAVLGLSSFAWGGERIQIDRLEVPRALEGKEFTLVARGGRLFDLIDPEGHLVGSTEAGRVLESRGVALFVSDLAARAGTQFRIARISRAKAISALKRSLSISELGKKTGVIRISLAGQSPVLISATLDAISRRYLRQNVERKSAEAEKMLAFITSQLPQLRANVEAAEASLNSYRANRGGGFDLTVETKAALDRAADVEKLSTEVEMQRSELRERFTESHPALAALNRKAALLHAERDALDQQLRALPETELKAARLIRDAKVANELYVLLLNKSQELQVVKSGTIGNVRILDAAIVPDEPESPNLATTLALSLLGGLALGIAVTFTRGLLGRGVHDPEVIERATGLPVYACIPHSHAQAEADAPGRRRSRPLHVLAADHPDDLAVEAIRSLRTSLQFALCDAPNNVIAIAGPSPGIGKSFLSVNLAHVLADVGKRVLLVDADLRNGHLHHSFGGERRPGVSELIRGTVTPQEAIRKTSVENLHFLAMGERPPNPSELLSSARFGNFMAETATQFDVVIMDTAPVLAVTDAALAARTAGTNLLVLRSGQHPLREIGLAVKHMTQSGVTPRAIVLNDVALSGGNSRYAGYHYQYDYR